MTWSKFKFGNTKRLKLQLLEALNKLDVILETRSLSSDEFSVKVSSIDEFDIIQHLEETMWR